jgi:hypothetical protein
MQLKKATESRIFHGTGKKLKDFGNENFLLTSSNTSHFPNFMSASDIIQMYAVSELEYGCIDAVIYFTSKAEKLQG